MAITSRLEVRKAPVCFRYGTRKVVAIGVALGCVLGAGAALAGSDGRFCSATANDQFKACGKEVKGVSTVGQVYRQEFSPGNAEDAMEVLSTTYGFGSDLELDQFVPRGLAELLCAARDCVVTGEFSPIEPDSFARKYYARGIGVFLEVVPATGGHRSTGRLQRRSEVCRLARAVSLTRTDEGANRKGQPRPAARR